MGPARGAGGGTASLPSPGADYRGQTCTLSGWGLVRRHPEQLADQLQKVSGQIWTRSQAQSVWGRNKPPNTVAFGQPGRWSACMGDSGGPLACGGTIVGIVSFGPGECDGKPGVFTEVSQFRSWISSKMVAVAVAVAAVVVAVVAVPEPLPALLLAHLWLTS